MRSSTGHDTPDTHGTDSSPATDVARRLVLARAASALGLAAGMACAPRLWTADRPFPRLPALEPLAALPALDAALATVLAACCVLCVLPRAARLATPTAAALALLLLLRDEMRNQPWVYQAILALSALALGAGRPRDLLAWLRLLVAATYLWSGVHKSHPVFVHEGWPWLSAPLAAGLPEAAAPLLAAAGWLAGPLEAALGVLLLLPRTRRAAVLFAVAMHLFILAMVGPWGHGWNAVVWPWNLTMAALLVVLFGGARAGGGGRLLPRGAALAASAAMLFLLVPAGHLLGLSHGYVAFALYSYATPTASYVLADELPARLPPDVAAAIERDDAGRRLLRADRWSLAAVGVPVPPAPRLFRRLHGALCALGAGPDAAHLVVRTPQRWRGTSTIALHRCGDRQPAVVRVVGAPP